MLTIYKASAGSGKTFQLVVEYIKLLLANPNNYRHILAVTFTNKATNEMKSRILEQLNLLANNQPSDYLEHLTDDKTFTESFIRERAKLVLKNILHDYNRFSVSTIDSFTQRTIKAFNRELGISPNFSLELDSEMILAEATDRLLAKVDTDKKLLKWLKDFSREQIEENNSQRIEEKIKSLGKELFKEKFQVFMTGEEEKKYTRKNLGNFGKELRKIKAGYETTLKNFGKNTIEIIENNALTIDDLAYGKNGVGGFLLALSNGIIKEPGNRVFSAETEVESWYSKSSKKKDEIRALAENKLQPLIIQILDFIRNNEENYSTAVVIQKQLRTLGILTDLKNEIKTLLHEKNVLQISDANLLLSKIIGQSESPFIYEKTGSYFHHFMLDEFQDTSDLQWRNFKPLVANSLAEGNKNLLVGDVKQSIYRWRNSNWQILAEDIQNDFREDQITTKVLKRNFRSDKNIIEFNNDFFLSLKDTFEEFQFKGLENPDELIKRFNKVYESVEQLPGKENPEKKGYVKIEFLPKEDFKNIAATQLVKQVKLLQDNGIKASETAILTRTNKEGKEIVLKFLEAAKEPDNQNYKLSVISNESLFLSASQGVMFVIYVLKMLANPDNEIVKIALLNLWINWLKPELLKQNKTTDTLKQISLFKEVSYENMQHCIDSELGAKFKSIKEKILLSSLDETVTQIAAVFGLYEIETELPFIQTLIDKAGELKSTLSNDLSNFLFWWEEQGLSTSVNVNEAVDSIRLLTIHKSKGLEFKAVLIPFFDWKTGISGNFAPILWCNPETEPFNKLPLLPVKATSSLEKTIFKSDYYSELVSKYVDVFNLAYVAFTRAKSVLIINCPQPEEPKRESNSAKEMHFLLEKTIQKLAQKEIFLSCFNEDEHTFEFGNIPDVIQEPQQISSTYIKKYHAYDFRERIKLRLSGENFLTTDEYSRSVKNRGKIIHEILSEIETYNDIEKAVGNAVFEGRITEQESNSIKENLTEIITSPQIKQWFDGTYNVINERNLLKKGLLLRPDRIMISGNSAIVVDYKTGDLALDKYQRQVNEYAKLLKETGIESVVGYLWYIQLHKVEKVCEY